VELWQAEDETELRQRALKRVQRRLTLRRKRLALVISLALAGLVALAVGYFSRNPGQGLIIFGAMAVFFLIAFGVDLYRLDEEDRRERMLIEEVDREIERLRAQRTKLKRDTLYRLSDDGELEAVDPPEWENEQEIRKRHEN
jgi:lipopolysaccharide export LptBFGC system permease protein LptF